MRADALLGRAHEVYRREPLGERDLGVFEDGADGGGELALAAAAFEQFARFVLAWSLPGDSVGVFGSALRAPRIVAPSHLLEESTIFVVRPPHDGVKSDFVGAVIPPLSERVCCP